MAEEYIYIEQTDAVQADVDLYDQAEAKGGDVEGDLTVSGKIEGSIDVSNVHGLAPVATSGDYADLTGTPTEFEGATASADGASGLVPKPEAGDQDKVLKGDGTWGSVASSQVPSLPSSKITSMTGYSKPSSTSAIATADSLNAAIGKLEKALDGKADLLISSTSPQFQLKSTDIARNTAPASNYSQVEIRSLDSQNKPTWGLYHRYYTNKKHEISLICYSGLTTDFSFASIAVGINTDGSAYTYAPTPPSGDDSTQIATTAFVTSGFVCKTGNENIDGTKTFLSPIHVSSDEATLGVFTHHIGMERGGTWTTSRTRFSSLDKNGKYIGDFSNYTYAIGSSLYNNAQIILYDPSDASAIGKYLSFDSLNWTNFTFAPDVNSDNLVNLGGSTRRWKQLFVGTATISTSDERCKDSIADIPDEVLDAWGKVRWRQFRFTDAVEEKGDAARLHSGAVAQDIQRIFSDAGLDASRYGLFCYDRWDAEPEQKDEEGNVVREAVAAGDRYSLRYEEALCMEAAYQRRRADRLEKRLADLEARLTAMEVANA